MEGQHQSTAAEQQQQQQQQQQQHEQKQCSSSSSSRQACRKLRQMVFKGSHRRFTSKITCMQSHSCSHLCTNKAIAALAAHTMQITAHLPAVAVDEQLR
jgi:hypothetical protein